MASKVGRLLAPLSLRERSRGEGFLFVEFVSERR